MKANVNIEFCGKKVVVKDLEEEAKFVWKDAGKKNKRYQRVRFIL